MSDQKPRGYDLVDDEARAAYDAIVEQMATAYIRKRPNARAAWRAMGDANGWILFRGQQWAVARLTKTQIIVESAPLATDRGMQRRFKLGTGEECGGRGYAGRDSYIEAVSLPAETVEAALAQVRATRSHYYREPGEPGSTPWGRSLLRLQDDGGEQGGPDA